MKFFNSIEPVDITNIELGPYKKHLADCVILTQNNKILMQRRPENWKPHGGMLCLFGGHVETGETIQEAVIRELQEELGARINPSDIIFIGAVSEEMTDHTELVHIHFWHDKNGLITGCYEGEAVSFNNIEDIVNNPKTMDYATWALQECTNRQLL